MSTTRLTFLYPHLFRAAKVSEPVAQNLRVAARPTRQRCLSTRGFATSGRRRDRLVERHGKAVEPFLVKGEAAEGFKVFTPETEAKEAKEAKTQKDSKPKPEELEKEAQQEEGEDLQAEPSSSAPLSAETQAAAFIPGDVASDVPPGKLDSEPMEEMTPLQRAAANTANPLAPLETVLQMPPPETQAEANDSKPPHLQAPPYIHHFDTYTLVRQVEDGGFTNAQSITAMKAVRGLLAINLDLAKAGLVSKSDVENETYLFRAACSELRTEVQNQRKANDEKMRRERTLLQHEVDILNQKLSQELLTLRDDLKGMFDDRKMAVRMEQRSMESAIQELNYKITVSLNSDSKSEVEAVRWVLTRRSVMGILFMAFIILSSLRFASLRSHEEEQRKKKEAERKPLLEMVDELSGPSAAEILAAG